MMFPKPAPTPKHKPKPLKRAPLKRKTRLTSRGLKPIPEEIRAIVIERDGGVCVLCGAPHDDLHHIQARNAGGPHTPENLVSLCRPCHRWAEDHPREAKARILEAMTGEAQP